MQKTELISRYAAFDLLHTVLRKNQAFDEAMGRHKDFMALEKRDRGFVHALVAMTLRRLGQIDDLIAQCLEQEQELKKPVQDILRLGIAQLVFLGTPPHAAVDTAVEMAAQKNQTKPYKGLINAILRRITREGAAMVAKQDAARLNTVDWLWLAWRKAYGTARARNIAEAHITEALIDISVKADPAKWAEKLGGKLLSTGSIRLPEAVPVQTLDGFEEGAWWVQDAAAALPVKLMGDVKGKLIYDLCTAPGGKAMQLAAAGATVIAVDRSVKRLARMEENLKRLKLEVDIKCVDALTLTPDQKADIVLLDAPCSATGTMRRHPDVPYMKTADDITRLAGLQEKLLDHAAAHVVKKGGEIIYAVCSLQAEEAEQQIEKFLERTPDFKRRPIEKDEIAGIEELISEAGDLRCFPCHWADLGGLDGFYVARLVSH